MAALQELQFEQTAGRHLRAVAALHEQPEEFVRQAHAGNTVAP